MVNSVLKAIRIMRLFNAQQSRLTLAEISRALDMPKSTAHNLLNTLLSEGFIEKADGEFYALGTAPLVLTQNIRVNVEFRDPAAPLLRELADTVRESAYLTVRDGDYALYIYAVESPQRLLARTAIGDRASMHCTSVGKAMLAWLPAEEVDGIVARAGLPASTPATITDPAALHEHLTETRARGYAVDAGEHEANIYCIGAPIWNRQGTVIGACSISGQSVSLVTDHLEQYAGHVMHAAQEISRRMGYVPASMSQLSPVHYASP